MEEEGQWIKWVPDTNCCLVTPGLVHDSPQCAIYLGPDTVVRSCQICGMIKVEEPDKSMLREEFKKAFEEMDEEAIKQGTGLVIETCDICGKINIVDDPIE